MTCEGKPILVFRHFLALHTRTGACWKRPESAIIAGVLLIFVGRSGTRDAVVQGYVGVRSVVVVIRDAAGQHNWSIYAIDTVTEGEQCAYVQEITVKSNQ